MMLPKKYRWRYSTATRYWYFEDDKIGHAHIIRLLSPSRRRPHYYASYTYASKTFKLLREAKAWIEYVVVTRRRKRSA